MGCINSLNMSKSGHGCRWLGSGWHRRCRGEPEVRAWLDVDVRMLETVTSRSTCGEMERQMPINRYGQTAMDYWKTWLPTRYSLLKDPNSYFASLGEQVKNLIESGCLDWTARDHEKLDSEDYLKRLGQLNAIRASVTEMVMADLVYLDSEPQTLKTGPGREGTGRLVRGVGRRGGDASGPGAPVARDVGGSGRGPGSVSVGTAGVLGGSAQEGLLDGFLPSGAQPGDELVTNVDADGAPTGPRIIVRTVLEPETELDTDGPDLDVVQVPAPAQAVTEAFRVAVNGSRGDPGWGPTDPARRAADNLAALQDVTGRAG